MHPIFTTVLSTIEGESTIIETVYNNRFAHIPKLIKMCAKILTKGQKLIIEVVKSLKGTSVNASDLRAGANLLLAAVKAKGTTEIRNVQQIERGYSNIVSKIQKIGVNIEAF